MGLSEKAKGKQRAVQLPVDANEELVYPQFRDLTVRFTDGVPDVTLAIKPGDFIRDVKRHVSVSGFKTSLDSRSTHLISNFEGARGEARTSEALVEIHLCW